MSDLAAPVSTGSTEPVDMSHVCVDPGWALRIASSLARRKKVIPCCEIDGQVWVACVDPDDPHMVHSVEQQVHRPLQFFLADEESLDDLIQKVYGSVSTRSAAPIRGGGGDDSAIAICDEIIQAAALRNASDIHIDPGADDIRIRLRVDGVIEEYKRLSLELLPVITSRLKVLGSMDISERRAPQDGRFEWASSEGGQGTELDIRVATLPTRNGEAITLRLLASKSTEMTLENLGMSQRDLASFTDAIHKPHGMVLLTGPTGSGKSTTLYSGICQLISQRDLHVITVEDPIEYEIDGVAQVAVDSADKVSFGKALRSMLRHDPDVIMIGEIRDGETGDVAIKASLTGHLVLSTLHTNSAASAVTRLTDMGIAPFLTGATLRLVVAQRLVRRLCPHCRVPEKLTSTEAIGLGDPGAEGQTAYRPRGCLFCAGRGIRGRMGLYEMLVVNEDISRAIATQSNESEILRLAQASGFRQLVDDAREKVLAGQITAQDALSAVTVF